MQDPPRGTGDAVRSARAGARRLRRRRARPERRRARPERRAARDAHRDAPRGDAAGDRALVRAGRPRAATAGSCATRDGGLARIVEAGDATAAELELTEVNSGIYVFRAEKLWPALERLEPQNAQGELYVTDTIGLLVADGEPVAVHVAPDPFEVEGINTRVELAAAAAGLRDRINQAHMLAGVTIVDPATTWIEPDVEIEPDVTIHPVRRPARAHPRSRPAPRSCPHVVAVDAEIGAGAIVGPFCYLRPGTVLEANSKAGTFVEIKNSRIGSTHQGASPLVPWRRRDRRGHEHRRRRDHRELPAPPGQPKGRTTIGKNVRTGVQNAFVAPVEVGDGAWIAAGSVITKDVPPDALADRPRPAGEQGGVCSPAPGRLSSCFPGLDLVETVTDPTPGHWIERGPQKRLMVFSGRSHPELAEPDHRAARRRARRGRRSRRSRTARPTAATTSRSAAPTSSSSRPAATPIDQNLMELLQMIQAAKLGSAKRITAVMPLFPYARQDRKAKPREPITARLVADLLQVAGADRILTMDLHAGQIQGFFTIPVDHMTALPLFARHFRDLGLHGEGIVSVSPDTGRAKQAERFAEMIESEFAIMHKSRPAHDVATVSEIAGRVKGKKAIIGDDVIMTGGTMLANVRALKEHGVEEVWIFATHGVFCGDSLERFAEADEIDGIVVTDTVPIDPLDEAGEADDHAGLGPPRRDDHERLLRRLGLGDLRRREPALLTRSRVPQVIESRQA